MQTPLAGAASEVALARASFIVREGLRRGWEVELLTTERTVALDASHARPFRLRLRSHLFPGARIPGQQRGELALPVARRDTVATAPRQPTTTRRGDVRTITELTSRLAAVAAGPLELPRDRVTTRVVSGGGDEWR